MSPKLSALLDVQQISDITKVINKETFERPIYAGNAIAKVKSNDPIKVICKSLHALSRANLTQM